MQLQFDPEVTSFDALMRAARAQDDEWSTHPVDDAQCERASAVYGEQLELVRAELRVPPKDQKYYLAQTALKFVPMRSGSPTVGNILKAKLANPTQSDSPAIAFGFPARSRQLTSAV